MMFVFTFLLVAVLESVVVHNDEETEAPKVEVPEETVQTK